MADRPLFSIVTITYENLAGLQATVASVDRQTCRDLEHVVVDGGSSDGSADWLAGHFPGTWVSEPDRGRYHAMNKGTGMATGEYVWYLHAGDVLADPAVLDRVARALHDRPAWAYGLARVVDPDGTLTGTLGFVPFSFFTFAVLAHPLPHQATVLRRELVERLGGYDESVPVAADQLLLLRAADLAPPRALPDFLCDFDSTGLSAGRPWLARYWDAERNRRRLGHPVTRSAVVDTLIAFSYAAVRELARRGRSALARPGPAPPPDRTRPVPSTP
ncbi:glycosyltransferase family 2 protein [Modestobacter sp. NPDC049651]|uniref:glycosyltransferase family 2 protein n=1 Tax=unclassified Modestobacter TaxID=2643866 RepID=UPI0033EB32C8